jgi:signal transduction histidine kinase
MTFPPPRVTDGVADVTLGDGFPIKPRRRPAGGTTERAVELGAVRRRAGGTDDGALCDARMPASVSVAFRRAVAHVRAEISVPTPADVISSDPAQALSCICDAVRRAYARGSCGPIGCGPRAVEILERLRHAFVEEIDVVRESLQDGELCRALHALDVVREEIDRDETHQFVTALKSDDALDLVVEIAHDMRSPLTAILLLTEAVRRARSSAGDQLHARQLGLVYTAAFGLNALANDVIALARGGDRLLERTQVAFSMSDLMQSTADILRPIAEERRLTLQVTTPPIDWRIGQPIALGRVLLNLTANALKYTTAGQVSMSAVDLSSTHVRVEITDTGPGIPADVLPQLFEPFGKRPRASGGRRFSRTGLGLAICRKLLRAMGSQLWVESAAGKGTRLYFDLPLAVGAESDMPSLASDTAKL